MLRPFGLVALLLLAACGDEKNSEAYSGRGYKSSDSASAGLLFAVVDKDFTTSQVLFNEFATGDVRAVSTGESGDPMLRWTFDKAFLFNRTSTSLNFRTFDPRLSEVTLSAQIATPSASLGDPHDVLPLDAGRMLVAQYNAGKLVVVNPVDGSLMQTIDASWDLGSGAKSQLRPSEFYSDGGKIYVIHHGLDAAFQPDGTQAVFVLEDDGKTVTVVDQDDAKAKVQGIPLPFKAPAGFYKLTDGSLVTYSECDMYSAPDCKAGFAKIDLAARNAAVVYETSGLIGNGGIARGEGDAFFALVAKGKEDASPKVIAKIDLAAKNATDVFTFRGTRGCCSLTFDPSTKTLYSGDVSASDPNAGVLLVFPDGAAAPTEVAVAGNPYGGLLVPK